MRLRSLVVALLVLSVAARAERVRSGPIQVDVAASPFGLTFSATDGGGLLSSVAGPAAGGPAALSVRTTSGWVHATHATQLRRSRGAIEATLATTDAQGGTIALRVEPAGDGIVGVTATWSGPAADVRGIAVAWTAPASERFFGLGERADAVEHRGQRVESYVSDGPWVPADRSLISNILPRPGFRARDDATYFPIPWILSSRGYGLLVDNDETAYHALATPDRPDAWSIELVGAPDGMAVKPGPSTLRFRVFAGPGPADVLERFTAAVGRQPKPAAPWVFGPWFQGDGRFQLLRDEDVPASVAQTYFHYLPCGGDHSTEPARTKAAHDLGYAITTYFNPMICTSNQPAYAQAVAAGALTKNAGGAPYVYQYFTSRFFDVSQFDFSARAGRDAYGSVLGLAVADGHDGWMEDFGEYTPLDSVSADGRDASATHNRYVTDYHCAAHDFARRQRRPIVRFQRSGWTGAARCAQVVWSGDPTTAWDFDGLRSVVTTGLGMGLSGVSRWGSDIGGFFSIFGGQLDGELLRRWVQLGAFSGVMRTQRDGIAIPSYDRPQVDDPDQLPHFRRYAKLRTQLYPYVAAADREYRRSGLPIMRHLALVDPDDPAAFERDDTFRFGPDLAVAPVVTPGATTRAAYVPRGTWIDFWRAVAYRSADGAFVLRDEAPVAPLSGGTVRTLPAPLDEIPLLVRAGAMLVLLPADVDTLADYGAGTAVVRLADRDRALHVLAFPRERSEGRFLDHGRWRSTESPGRWQLSARAERRATWTIEAALGSLSAPFPPCSVSVNKRRLPDGGWTWDPVGKVLRATVEGRTIRLDVRSACE